MAALSENLKAAIFSLGDCMKILLGLFLILNISTSWTQSSYSSANQDTEQNSKANTQNDNGYVNNNEDIRREEKKQKEEERFNSNATSSEDKVWPYPRDNMFIGD